jgi:hypothetical protein
VRVSGSSFIKFIYPFLFDSDSFERHSLAISTAQRVSSKHEHNVWLDGSFAIADLLPHVAQPLSSDSDNLPSARIWNFNQALRDSFPLPGRGEWTMNCPNGAIPFRFGHRGKRSAEVQLIMFQVGVGFLVVETCPMGESLEAWLDFLHWFRLTRGQRGVDIRRIADTGNESVLAPASVSATKADQQEEPGLVLGDFLDTLLQTGNADGTESKWWREVYVKGKLLPFAGLFVEEITPEDIPMTLCSVRHFFHSREDTHPSDAELSLTYDALQPYANKQWFLFALEGAAFVACDPPDTPFFRETLPSHLASSYYLVYIMALHQRFALIGLSENVSLYWSKAQQSKPTVGQETLFAKIRGTLNSFTAWGYFTQVMQQQHHHDYYQKWQGWLQIDKLYREVSDQVREIYEFSLMSRTRRLEQRISFLGVMTGIPALLLFFLGLNLKGITVEQGGLTLPTALILVGAGLAVALVILWFLRK